MYAVGIDIGGTNTRVALIDRHYNMIKRVQFATNYEDPFGTLNQIKDEIQSWGVNIVGVGLSCPGPLDLKNGKILNTPNLGEHWQNFEIQNTLRDLLNVPVYLENDANLACLAESVVGEGKEYRYVQFLTISTGVGSGLVIDKNIYQGAHGFAHEIANIPLWNNGPSHGNIYPGGVEAICSGTAITLRSKDQGLEVNHAGDVAQLANEGNEIAANILDDAIEYLANTIAIIYALIDPEIVILGGSVAIKINGFIEEVEKRVKNKVFKNMIPYVNIRKTSLNEDSGLLGAASLAFLKCK